MRKPITIVDAEKRHLLAFPPAKGIHTFSNGTEGCGWMECNCFECRFYEHEGCAGEFCAFEGALMPGWVTPELAELFGWVRSEKYPDSWDAPSECPFYHERTDDNGEEYPLPPDPDPAQLVLIADPTEIIAGLVPSIVPEPKRKICQTA